MAKNWIIKPREPVEPLVPDYERDLHDPFLMKGMDKAVARILAAIAAGEKIVIFGDYDADGVPGTAVLAEFFRQIKYTNFDIYLPDRHLEQYGLSVAIVEKLVKAGTQLLITVDCGIANQAEISLAKSLGIEVIVTDHHLVGETLPAAVAILNPKQADDNYPDKWLCGAGVAFKLVQALASQKEIFLGSSETIPRTQEKSLSASLSDQIKWLLDLVAIATISDMVPLVGENRALVYFGLKVLRRTRRLGLLELYRRLNLRAEYLTEDDVAFSIAPRINTASRMAHARDAYCLLTTTDPATAEAVAEHLEEKNGERKQSVADILRALEVALAGDLPAVIVAGHPEWSLGVLGLTASRVLEKYGRPVFLWGQNGNGEIRGSCRSDGSINVVELMQVAGGAELFSNFGGHHHAGGFALSLTARAAADPGAELFSRLNSAYPKLEPQEIETDLLIDRELNLDEVVDSLVRELSAFAPFGVGNPKPVFLFANATVSRVKTFGAAGEHLELAFLTESGRNINAISFFNLFPQFNFHSGQHLDLAATIDQSYFRGRPELRLRIVDLRPAS